MQYRLDCVLGTTILVLRSEVRLWRGLRRKRLARYTSRPSRPRLRDHLVRWLKLDFSTSRLTDLHPQNAVFSSAKRG